MSIISNNSENGFKIENKVLNFIFISDIVENFGKEKFTRLHVSAASSFKQLRDVVGCYTLINVRHLIKNKPLHLYAFVCNCVCMSSKNHRYLYFSSQLIHT